MDLQINRWGNSLAVRLPAKLARELNVGEGSQLEATVTGPGRLTLQSAELSQAVPSREEVIAELEALHRNMPMGRSVVRFMRDQGY
jgi:antitoxin MazE